jgi:hypothetical protein
VTGPDTGESTGNRYAYYTQLTREFGLVIFSADPYLLPMQKTSRPDPRPLAA